MVKALFVPVCPKMPSVTNTGPTLKPRFFLTVSWTFGELWLDFHQGFEAPRRHSTGKSSSQSRCHGLSARYLSGDTIVRKMITDVSR